MCEKCILEPYLRETIEHDGNYTTCFYCGQKAKTFLVDDITDRVEEILSALYNPLVLPLDDDEERGQLIDQLIKELLQLDNDNVADDVRELLSERWMLSNDIIEYEPDLDPFSPGRTYIKRISVEDVSFDLGWRQFESSLKTKARHFNTEAEHFLKSVFIGLEERRTVSGLPVVVNAGPNTRFDTLYRARVFQREEDFRAALEQPDVEIGPPRSSSSKAGRMNATGITVFYGATSAAVALAEVRPPVGNKVLVGCFEVIRPLKLLDLVALTKLADRKGSLFDLTYLEELSRAQFLRGLTTRLSKPVMPSDELSEHIPPQAIADFLAGEGMDGIIYPSVQVGGGLSQTKHSDISFSKTTLR